MKSEWLIHNNNKSLILFFNGWGQDTQPFQPFPSDSHDVFMFSDYRHLNEWVEWNEEFDTYESITLVAWSMGVLFANFYMLPYANKINFKLAINGTLHPIHDEWGIPEKVYAGTSLTLNDRNLEKFNKRMFFKSAGEALFLDHLPQRGVEELKEELQSIAEFSDDHVIQGNIFDFAILGENDLIFPHKNLLDFWQKIVPVKSLPQPHFPFYSWPNWDNLLQTISEKVG